MKVKAKRVTTVRLDQEDYEKIQRLANKTHQTESEVLRESIKLGIIDLVNGEDEDELLRRRISPKEADIDGVSFIKELKSEFGLK